MCNSYPIKNSFVQCRLYLIVDFFGGGNQRWSLGCYFGQIFLFLIVAFIFCFLQSPTTFSVVCRRVAGRMRRPAPRMDMKLPAKPAAVFDRQHSAVNGNYDKMLNWRCGT